MHSWHLRRILTATAGDHKTDHVTDHMTGCVTEHVTDHVADRVADRVTDHVTDRVTDRTTDRATDRWGGRGAQFPGRLAAGDEVRGEAVPREPVEPRHLHLPEGLLPADVRRAVGRRRRPRQLPLQVCPPPPPRITPSLPPDPTHPPLAPGSRQRCRVPTVAHSRFPRL